MQVLVFYYDGNEHQVKTMQLQEKHASSTDPEVFELPETCDISLVVTDVRYNKIFVNGQEVV